jgi:hypothetical protein
MFCRITQTANPFIILSLKIFLKTAFLNTHSNLQFYRDHSFVFNRRLIKQTLIFRPAEPRVFIKEKLHVSVLTGHHHNYSLHPKTGSRFLVINDFRR